MNTQQPLVTKEGSQGDNSSKADANAQIHDATGKVLAIVSFGLSCIALGAAIVLLILMPKLLDSKVDTVQSKLDINSNRAQVSENHWREIETK